MIKFKPMAAESFAVKLFPSLVRIVCELKMR